MVARIESLPSTEYHASEGVSNSMLKWISSPYTPRHYKAKFIDREMPEEESPDLTFGTIFHRLLNEAETMGGAFHVKPEGMNFSTKDGKAWRADHQDRPIVAEADAKALKTMRDRVWAHREARALLTGARTEACLFAEDSDGTLRKGRLDAIPAGGNALVDLKSIVSVDDDTVRKAIVKRRYFVQCPFYLDLARLCGIERDVFVFIFVEKTPPYLVSVRPLDEFAENVGRKIYQADLARLRNCLETNQWPGDPHDGTDCGLTSWMQSLLEREGI